MRPTWIRRSPPPNRGADCCHIWLLQLSSLRAPAGGCCVVRQRRSHQRQTRHQRRPRPLDRPLLQRRNTAYRAPRSRHRTPTIPHHMIRPPGLLRSGPSCARPCARPEKNAGVAAWSDSQQPLPVQQHRTACERIWPPRLRAHPHRLPNLHNHCRTSAVAPPNQHRSGLPPDREPRWRAILHHQQRNRLREMVRRIRFRAPWRRPAQARQ